MDQKLVFAPVAAAFIAASAASAAEFSELEISSSKTGVSKDFAQSGASATISEIGEQMGEIDSIVRKAPGVYTNIDTRAGGLSVNLRSQSGLGRANVLIDGMLQTAIAAAPGEKRFHETGELGNNYSSGFGAFVDPNFLADASFSSGVVRGAAGANTLIGAAEFRTIDAADVLRPGQAFGAMIKAGYESNKVGPNGMIAAAARAKFGEADEYSASVLVGISARKSSQDYKVGGGGKKGDVDGLMVDFGVVEDAEDNVIGLKDEVYGSKIVENTKALEQKQLSILAKAELASSAARGKFTYKNYQNELYKRKVSQNDFLGDFLLAPGSEWLNLHAFAGYSQNDQKYDSDAVFKEVPYGAGGLKLRDKTLSLALENSQEHALASGELSLDYGASYVQNEYQKLFSKDAVLRALGNDPAEMDQAAEDDYLGKTTHDGLMPNAKSKTLSAHLGANYAIAGANVSAGGNLANVKLQGYKPACQSTESCFPSKETSVSKSIKTYGGYLMADYELHELFVPYVGKTYAQRAPNLNEMFFFSDGRESVNPFLKKERLDGYEFGARGGYELGSIALGYKLSGYVNDIKDYILMKQFNVLGASEQFSEQVFVYTNSPKTVRLKGLDASAELESRYVFAKLAYSWAKTNQPTSDGAVFESQYQNERLYIQPEHRASVDLGAHLLGGALDIALGLQYFGSARYIDILAAAQSGEREYASMNGEDTWENIATTKLSSAVVAALNAKWRITSDIYIAAAVHNLFDKKYIDPLDTLNSSSAQRGYAPAVGQNEDGVIDAQQPSNYARGRSFAVQIAARF